MGCLMSNKMEPEPEIEDDTNSTSENQKPKLPTLIIIRPLLETTGKVKGTQ